MLGHLHRPVLGECGRRAPEILPRRLLSHLQGKKLVSPANYYRVESARYP